MDIGYPLWGHHRDVDNYGFHFNKYSKNKIVLDPKNKQDKG